MHGHLVTIEVGVIRGADERVNANGFALNQHRLKCLHRETVQRGCAVEHHGVAFGDLLKHVPHLRSLPLDEFLGGPHGVHITQFLEPPDDEWLEENERHLLGQAALVKLQFRANNNDGTARVIHTLAKQVLAETPALALEHVREGF